MSSIYFESKNLNIYSPQSYQSPRSYHSSNQSSNYSSPRSDGSLQFKRSNSIPLTILCKIPKNKQSKNYRNRVDEVFRIDCHVIKNLFPEHFKHIKTWSQKKQFHWTRHAFCERLQTYINKLDKSKQYIEIFPDEFEWIKHLPRHLNNGKLIHWSLEEIGWNSYNEVCKVSFTICMDKLITEKRGRYLFICLGMDGGIKTCFVTPEYKYRQTYRGGNYISLEELQEKINVFHNDEE